MEHPPRPKAGSADPEKLISLLCMWIASAGDTLKLDSKAMAPILGIKSKNV